MPVATVKPVKRVKPKDPAAAALQAITAALHQGALQNLQDLVFVSCTVGDENFKALMEALEDSGCVPRRLKTLGFTNCGIGMKGVRSFTGLLRQGTFPALNALGFANNPDIEDVGVLALVRALQQCTETFLDLDLNQVGMGDDGLLELAYLLYRGRFKHLQRLNISYNRAITDRGIIALARAIGACGLPKLEELWVEGLNKLTVVGCTAIAHAVRKGCPNLRFRGFRSNGTGLSDNILAKVLCGMLEVDVMEKKFWRRMFSKRTSDKGRFLL